MQCEKCRSEAMEPRRLFRLSGCLVFAGFALIATSAIAVVFAVLFAAVGPRATRDAESAHAAQTKGEAVAALRRIPALPETVLQEFESNGRLSEDTLSRLPFEQRDRVLSVMLRYHGGRVGEGAATIM